MLREVCADRQWAFVAELGEWACEVCSDDEMFDEPPEQPWKK
jgi:hypothetical protein